jgi:glutathione S-transferase
MADAGVSRELYLISGSPFAWRVLLALEVKGLPYQTRVLEYSKGEHRSPAYLALNPRGRVPTLRDGDTVVRESLAIIAYLDRKYPEPPLFGATPVEAAQVWESVCETTSDVDPAGETYTVPIYFGETERKGDQIRAAVPRMRAELARLETTLRDRNWLVGRTVSAADIVLYPMVKSFERAASKPAAASFGLGMLPVADRYPALARWMARVEALPGYARTYPPHWR